MTAETPTPRPTMHKPNASITNTPDGLVIDGLDLRGVAFDGVDVTLRNCLLGPAE